MDKNPDDNPIASSTDAADSKSKHRNQGIEIEEGEVPEHADGSVQNNPKKEGHDDADKEDKTREKKSKKEKKHKHSERESKERSSRKNRDDDGEESRKKKKDGKDKKKKKDKDRGSPSRSKSPKKKHRSSRSFSKKTKSNRKKSGSSSRSRSRSRSKSQRERHNKKRVSSRSRSKERRRERERSTSRSRLINPNRRRSPRKEGRSSRDREKERRRSNERRRSPRKDSRERDEHKKDKNKEEEKRKEEDKMIVEEEPVDEEASKAWEMAFAEVDEEKLARERREQRRALLEKFAKKNDEDQQRNEEAEERKMVIEKAPEEKQVVQKEVNRMEEEKPPVVVNEEIVKGKEEDKIVEEQKVDGDDEDDEAEGKEEGWAKNHRHNVDKESYLKMIDNMRDRLEKEEEEFREEVQEEAKNNNKEITKAIANQDFDMFTDTPEDIYNEKVYKPTVNGADHGDDDQGYYRGQIGEVMKERYKITAKLGKGVFGIVLKGQDMTTGQEVAIKILKTEEIYMMSGLKEKEMLTILNEADKHNKRHVIRLVDSFDYYKHLVLVFELMEMDLRTAIKTFGKKVGLSLESVRSYARQLLIALGHLRKHKIIHADLKPDNILVTNNQKTLKLADFGSAFTVDENTITPCLVARYYRPPEIILGCPYDCAVDMWSAACTIFELYTGTILFPGKDNNEMLKLIIQTKGRLNNKMQKRGEFSHEYFDKQNNFLSTEIDPVTKEETVKPIPIGHKITRDIGEMLNAVPMEAGQEEDTHRKKIAQLKELLERCLTLDPNKRMTPDEALKSQFINYGIQKPAFDPSTIKHAF